jgi:hypothetical protein
LVEHDLFGKPASTFPDHALGGDCHQRPPRLPRRSVDDIAHAANLMVAAKAAACR